jgi:aspartate--ammonia ligase
MSDKTKDLAGSGIGDYKELAKDLPDGYEALLPPMGRMRAVFAVKNYIESLQGAQPADGSGALDC